MNNGYGGQERVVSPTGAYAAAASEGEGPPAGDNRSHAATQTLSTGDIVVTKIYFTEGAE